MVAIAASPCFSRTLLIACWVGGVHNTAAIVATCQPRELTTCCRTIDRPLLLDFFPDPRGADAIAEFEQERAINPLYGGLYDRLGDAYLRAGEYDKRSRR